MKLRQVLISVLILIPLAVPAQDSGKGLSFDLSYMTRGEIRNGGLVKGDESADDFAAFLLGRTRLGLKYEGQGISSRLTAQHSGTWGSQGGGTLGIYEAWVQLQSRQGLFVRVGRQNLSYDDQRIFGSDDFSMTGMSHDVLKAGFEGNGHKFHVFAAFNQNGENTSGGGTYFSGGYQPYKAMESAWYHYDFKRIPMGASLLFLNLGMQGGEKGEDNARTWQQQLAGTYLSFKPKGWSFEGAFYYQMGKQEDGVPIRAFMGSTKAVYSPGIYSLYAGYDYLSGDKFFALPPNGAIGMALHDTIRGFNAIYGSHHDFYGAMDFFYLDSFVGNFTPGLQTLYVGGNINPIKKLNIDLSYHYYAITTNLERIPSKTLGHDLEIKASYAFSDDIRLSAGYSFLIGTDTMATLQQLDERRRMSWGWLMLSITPKLYTTTWQDKK